MTFEIDCVAQHPPVRLVFREGHGAGELRGLVLDSSGTPRGDMDFGVWRVRGGITFETRAAFPTKAAVTSDAQGRVVVRGLPEGRYMVVRTPGHRVAPSLIDVDREPFLEVDVPAEGPASFEWVVDPVPPAKLVAHLADGVGAIGKLRVAIESSGSTPIVREGWFQKGECLLDDLPPGQATLELGILRADDPPEVIYVALNPPTVSLQPGRAAEVTLAID